jgi:hypothetical protein
VEIHRAIRQQRQLAFDKQRVQVFIFIFYFMFIHKAAHAGGPKQPHAVPECVL